VRTYEVEISDDSMIVLIVVDRKIASTIIVPRLDAEKMGSAFEELLETAYLDGKMDERSARRV